MKTANIPKGGDSASMKHFKKGPGFYLVEWEDVKHLVFIQKDSTYPFFVSPWEMIDEKTRRFLLSETDEEPIVQDSKKPQQLAGHVSE